MSSGPNKSIYGKGEERSGGRRRKEDDDDHPTSFTMVTINELIVLHEGEGEGKNLTERSIANNPQILKS